MTKQTVSLPCLLCAEGSCLIHTPVDIHAAIKAVREGVMTDADIRAVIDMSRRVVPVKGVPYRLADLADAIKSAQHYGMNRYGGDWLAENV